MLSYSSFTVVATGPVNFWQTLYYESIEMQTNLFISFCRFILYFMSFPKSAKYLCPRNIPEVCTLWYVQILNSIDYFSNGWFANYLMNLLELFWNNYLIIIWCCFGSKCTLRCLISVLHSFSVWDIFLHFQVFLPINKCKNVPSASMLDLLRFYTLIRNLSMKKTYLWNMWRKMSRSREKNVGNVSPCDRGQIELQKLDTLRQIGFVMYSVVVIHCGRNPNILSNNYEMWFNTAIKVFFCWKW